MTCRNLSCSSKAFRKKIRCFIAIDVLVNKVHGFHKVLHTFKILISQKPHIVETLDFRQ